MNMYEMYIFDMFLNFEGIILSARENLNVISNKKKYLDMILHFRSTIKSCLDIEEGIYLSVVEKLISSDFNLLSSFADYETIQVVRTSLKDDRGLLQNMEQLLPGILSIRAEEIIDSIMIGFSILAQNSMNRQLLVQKKYNLIEKENIASKINNPLVTSDCLESDSEYMKSHQLKLTALMGKMQKR